MTPELEEALSRWEIGELSRDELVRRFPDADVPELLDAFERMSTATVGPTPDAGEAWEAVRAALPVRLTPRRPHRPKAIRLLAAATLAMLLMGATSYALVPGVRDAVNEAVGVSSGDADPSPERSASSVDVGSKDGDPAGSSTGNGGSGTDPAQARTTSSGAEDEGDGGGDNDDDATEDADDEADAEDDDGEADDTSEPESRDEANGDEEGSGEDVTPPGSGDEDPADGDGSGGGSEDEEN